jgi:hypothetical protein
LKITLQQAAGNALAIAVQSTSCKITIASPKKSFTLNDVRDFGIKLIKVNIGKFFKRLKI